MCLNHVGGYRNSVTFALVGLDLDAKAEWVTEALFERAVVPAEDTVAILGGSEETAAALRNR